MGQRSLAVLLVACGCTIRGYEGDVPEEERAAIVSHSAGAVYVRVLEIDGVRVDEDWYQGGTLELSPGAHRITLDVKWKALARTAWISWGVLPWLGVNAATTRQAEVEFVVAVRPGRRYVFTATVTSREMPEYEIVDAATDELVAGKRRDGLLALAE